MIGEAAQQGWSAQLRLVEVGYRGFLAKSTVSPLYELSIMGQKLAAERASE